MLKNHSTKIFFTLVLLASVLVGVKAQAFSLETAHYSSNHCDDLVSAYDAVTEDRSFFITNPWIGYDGAADDQIHYYGRVNSVLVADAWFSKPQGNQPANTTSNSPCGDVASYVGSLPPVYFSSTGSGDTDSFWFYITAYQKRTANGQVNPYWGRVNYSYTKNFCQAGQMTVNNQCQWVTGSITANPTSCATASPTAPCNTTIAWSSNALGVEVRRSDGSILSTASSGSVVEPLSTSGTHTYTLYLKDGYLNWIGCCQATVNVGAGKTASINTSVTTFNLTPGNRIGSGNVLNENSVNGGTFDVYPTLPSDPNFPPGSISFDMPSGDTPSPNSQLPFTVTVNGGPATPGTYQVNLAVNGDGTPYSTSVSPGSTALTINYTVSASAPTASLTITGGNCSNSHNCIVVSGTSVTFNWSSSGGSTYTTTNSSLPPGCAPGTESFGNTDSGNHTFTVPAAATSCGTQTIRYTVTNSSGVSATDVVYFTAAGLTPGVCNIPPHTGTYSTMPSGTLCSQGNASPVTGSGPWTWSCSGVGGGATNSCYANLSSGGANGQCGPGNGVPSTYAPPPSQLCWLGSPSAVTGGSSQSDPWTWSCSGINGGNPAPCAAPVITGPPILTLTAFPSSSPTAPLNNVIFSFTRSSIDTSSATGQFFCDTTGPLVWSANLGGTQPIFNYYSPIALNVTCSYPTTGVYHPKMIYYGATGARTTSTTVGVGNVTITPVNGACGTANKTYSVASSSFGSDTICQAGTANPDPSFPAVGGSVAWKCMGIDGGTDSPQCIATHSQIASCGTRNKTYPAGSTSYGAGTTYCASGTESSSPAFPSGGGSVSWTCNDAPIAATGGTITTSGGYATHTFTGSGTFQITSGGGFLSAFIVAGGGGGGGMGGGGGGGGVSNVPSYWVYPRSYPVVVGAGGAGLAYETYDDGSSTGGNSSFDGMLIAGGGSGSAFDYPGGDGGSGGGGGGVYSTAGGTGYSGGNGTGGDASGEFGGGGGGAGGNATDGTYGGIGGNGGPGYVSSISGSSVTYGSGGGGGGMTSGGTASSGGGAGRTSSGMGPLAGFNGTPNTGGGGGGTGVAFDGSTYNTTGGNGGSGIVIVRYPTAGSSSPQCTATNPVSSITGVCGTANKTYPVGSTDFGGDSLCAPGTSNPNPVAFPLPGTSVNWTCLGSGGGSNSPQCTATNPTSTHSLTVTKAGGGRVQSVDGNINCGSACFKDYAVGANVTLQGIPDSSYWKFLNWTVSYSNGSPTGECAGSGVCMVNMSVDKNVHAVFTPRTINYTEF